MTSDCPALPAMVLQGQAYVCVRHGDGADHILDGQGRRHLRRLLLQKPHTQLTGCELSVAQELLVFNWLRVLDTTERPQIDQGIGHQLHPIVSLLDAFKP